MGVNRLERASAAAGLSAPVHWHEVTGSTNAIAADLADGGAPEWTLVGAGHQTAGRGRRGRSWQDRPGRALMTSVVLRPSIAPSQLGLLTLLAGAAWAEAIEASTGLEVRCKWPNDLLTADGKVGGVLAESSVAGDRVRWVVIGSGVNLEAPEVEGAAAVVDGGPGELLGAFLTGLRRTYEAPPDGFADEVVERWTSVAATIGERVAAVGADGARIEGLAVGIDRTGALEIDTSDGLVRIASDEVEHLR
jgi:BirA family biotin operon repressor/biotin-[acetyl-CoA-carboxylase] ligase